MESQLCQTDPDQASTCLDQVLLEFKEESKALGEKFNVINILKLNFITRSWQSLTLKSTFISELTHLNKTYLNTTPIATSQKN